MSLADAILAELRQRPRQTARQLARALRIDKQEVNSCLYGALGGRVAQDREYRWSLVGSSSPQHASPASASVQPRGLLSRLCDYYLDCLLHGEGENVSVFATSYGQPTYAELSVLPGSLEADNNPFRASEATRIVSRCVGPRASGVLKVGYPVLLVERTSAKGSNYSKVEPIFVWAPDAARLQAEGTLALLGELPDINMSAISSLATGGPESAREELGELLHELGLDAGTSAGATIEIDELVYRLCDIRPEWPWIEDIDCTAPSEGAPLGMLNRSGIYNRAIVTATERSTYTRGLEQELAELARQPDQGPASSALAHWVSGGGTEGRESDDAPVLEVLPLNEEQRLAVQRALTRRLTVITGPPGTGKSQVVTSILVNAAHQGKRVLFASKNNKAVDVVEERVNGLGARPVLLRLGRGEYTAALHDHISRMLATTASEQDRRDHDEAIANLAQLRARSGAIGVQQEALIALRNSVDGLEQAAEVARVLLGAKLFAEAPRLDLAGHSTALRQVSAALTTIDKSLQSWWRRATWAIGRKARLDRAREITAGARPVASKLGIELPTTVAEDSLSAWRSQLGDWEKALHQAERARSYFQALSRLSASVPLEGLHAQVAALQEAMEDVSLRLWQKWLLLQSSLLSRENRKTLADYAAVLELVSRTDDGGEASRAAWSQYQRLSQKVVGILPCWAVTALSARGRIPLTTNVFDLVVIDEASQCDIGSALPLLFRAKSAVVLGDPMQLRHISAVSGAQDTRLLHRHGLLDTQLAWAHSRNSLFDVAMSVCGQDEVITLLDHHRSDPAIIGFSNDTFYEGRLRVATRLSQLRRPPGASASVRWVHVTGQAVRPRDGSLVNEVEARRVVVELEHLLVEQGYQGSVGVVSPFRKQATRILDLANASARLQPVMGRADLLIDTVHRFQGDERDVMFFSPAISSGEIGGALGFLRSTGNLFNVAITRARASLVVVGDPVAAKRGDVGHLSKFAEYAAEVMRQASATPTESQDFGPNYPAVIDPSRVSEWERILYRALYRAGVRPIPQYHEEKYDLDLAVIVGDRRLDIEVDGERYHREWSGELCRRDQLRNMRLMELGWDVMRFWVYQVRDDLDGCVRRVQQWVDAEARR